MTQHPIEPMPATPSDFFATHVAPLTANFFFTPPSQNPASFTSPYSHLDIVTILGSYGIEHPMAHVPCPHPALACSVSQAFGPQPFLRRARNMPFDLPRFHRAEPLFDHILLQ